MYTDVHVKYPLVVSDFSKNSKNPQISNFMTFPAVSTQMFLADR